MAKPYDVGLVCGRFQTFHKGHEKLVENNNSTKVITPTFNSISHVLPPI